MSDYDSLMQILDGGATSRGYTTATTYGSAAAAGQGIMIWTIIALILAIVGGILVHFLFVKAKTDPKNKFLKWLKDFLAFKSMWIETILKISYYILTIFAVLFSFTYLALGGAGILAFFLSLILAPIVIRVIYEASLMFIMIWRNTRDIAENTKKK